MCDRKLCGFWTESDKTSKFEGTSSGKKIKWEFTTIWRHFLPAGSLKNSLLCDGQHFQHKVKKGAGLEPSNKCHAAERRLCRRLVRSHQRPNKWQTAEIKSASFYCQHSRGQALWSSDHDRVFDLMGQATVHDAFNTACCWISTCHVPSSAQIFRTSHV